MTPRFLILVSVNTNKKKYKTYFHMHKKNLKNIKKYIFIMVIKSIPTSNS